ncbi:MAG: hypothetical protein R3E72_02385 [Steroidobacteraceae bacterium]
MNSISAHLPAFVPNRLPLAPIRSKQDCGTCEDQPQAASSSKIVSLDVKQQAATRAADAAATDLVVQAVRRAIEDKASLTFRTQEGDIVKIRLTSRTITRSEAGDDSDRAAQSIKSQTRLSVHIKGDINADERAAIQSIVDKVETLARDFFNGDVKKAFAAAAELELDPAQLASFALQLRHRERTSGGAAQSPAQNATSAADAPAASTPAPTPTPPSAVTTPVAKTLPKPTVTAPAHTLVKPAQTSAAPPTAVLTPTTVAPGPAVPAAPTAAVAPATAALPSSRPPLSTIGTAIGNFLTKLFDALEISLKRTDDSVSDDVNMGSHDGFSARFKLDLLFHAVEALATAPPPAETDKSEATSTAGDPSTAVTWPGESDPKLTSEATAHGDSAATNGAIKMLDQVLEASLEQTNEAAPGTDAGSVRSTESSLSMQSTAHYEAAARGSYRVSLSINMVA